MKYLKSALFTVGLLFLSCKSTNLETNKPVSTTWNTNYNYVFVHGLAGWGQYDFTNHFYHYFGCSSGSLVKKLKKHGITAYEASVDPQGSAWDRACELYAQMTGTVVDYGVEHSARCGHERFGKDFSKQPLITQWDEEHKINFIAHSFGGMTVRLLSELMENGSPQEIAATPSDQLSPLFAGGHKDWIYSISTFATPHNGTSGYHIEHPAPKDQTFNEKNMARASQPVTDGRKEYDYAAYDMKITGSEKLNEIIHTFDDIYYFSYAGCTTTLQPDGTQAPKPKTTENLYESTSARMGKWEGTTKDGVYIGKEWQANDGLVNTISALAPFNAPQVEFITVSGDLQKGIWYVMPIVYRDHISFQGGATIKNPEFFDLYYTQIDRINCL